MLMPADLHTTAPSTPRRGFGRSVLWIAGATLTLVVLALVSLLITSEGLTFEQRRVVTEALAVVEQGGFEREATVLRNVVFYRSTDNWWNKHVGHVNAYAATNFPFAVVTLYPAFFRFSVDATERAAMLLHESHHVFGADERMALQRVWLDKQRLGWTAQQYSHTRVWKNTREWTMGAIPALFQCGADEQSDCVE
jgi:hypothetical protein